MVAPLPHSFLGEGEGTQGILGYWESYGANLKFTGITHGARPHHFIAKLLFKTAKSLWWNCCFFNCHKPLEENALVALKDIFLARNVKSVHVLCRSATLIQKVCVLCYVVQESEIHFVNRFFNYASGMGWGRKSRPVIGLEK